MSRLAYHVLTLIFAAVSAGLAVGLFLGAEVPRFSAAGIGILAFAVAMLLREVLLLREQRLALEEVAQGDHRILLALRPRIERMDDRLKTAEAAVARLDGEQSAVEIATLGTLLRDLAEAVAAQEKRLAMLGGLAAGLGAPAPPAAAAGPVAAVEAPAPVRPADAGTAPHAAPAAPPETLRAIADALAADGVELTLQPIVTLPQRRARLYEVLPLLRLADGRLVGRADFGPVAAALGREVAFDRHLLMRGLPVLRRIAARSRDLALVMGISAATLEDEAFLGEVRDLAERTPGLAAQFVLRLDQPAFAAALAGPARKAGMAAIAAAGIRLAMGEALDLRLDAGALAAHGVRFVGVPARTLLAAAGAGTDIHAADLAALLARSGIELVAGGIEDERTVADLLDYDVGLAQGRLFAAPRPVRADVAGEEVPASPAASASPVASVTPASPTPAVEVSPAPVREAPRAASEAVSQAALDEAAPAASAQPVRPRPMLQPVPDAAERPAASAAPDAPQGPLTLGEAALFNAIDRFRRDDKGPVTPAPERTSASAWRTLARRVQTRERA